MADRPAADVDGAHRQRVLALRRHFKVDAPSIVLKVLEQLVKRGEKDRSVLREAIDRYSLDDVGAAPTGNTEGSAE